MELTLALNAAENRLQLALADGTGVYLYGLECRADSQGAEKLAPALRSALALCGAKTKDIRRVACVAGPGSFTGLRLTTVTAAGLARAAESEQAAIGYLGLLARESMPALSLAAPETHLWVLVRARRDLVYMQGFQIKENVFSAPAEFCPVLAAPLKAVPGIIAARSGAVPLLLAGSGVSANEEALRAAFAEQGGPADTRLLPRVHDHPRIEALLEAALAASYGQTDITPFYLRPSDAEENLPAIAARLGLDPEAAQAKLRELTSSKP